jgi:hypothetical protein
MQAARMLIVSILFFLLLGSTPYFREARADTSDVIETSEEIETDDDSELSDFEEDDTAGFGEEKGFGDIKVDLQDTGIMPVEESMITFGGFFKEEADYSYAKDDPDYSKIRSTLNLSLDLKISEDWQAKIMWNGFYDYVYSYRGRDKFTDETLEVYESESEFRDVYVDGGITRWMRIKIGRQIIAWGQSDTSQITDMANPRDLRELGMVDLEDARIPVGATKLAFLFGSLELDAVAIHEIRVNKTPAAGSEFDFLQDVRALSFYKIDDEEVPESNAENTEYLVRLFKVFNGGDFGVTWADVYEDYFHLDFSKLVVSNVLPDPTKALFQLTVIPRHKRIKTYGFSANLVVGSWLYKTELARKVGIALARNDIETQLKAAVTSVAMSGGSSKIFDEDSGVIKTWSEKNVLNGMIGVEYSGFTDITLSLEAVGEQIEDYEDNLNSKELTGQLSFIGTYTALNDTFDAQLFWIHFTGDNGDVFRVNAGYDLIDALNLSGGFIVYEATEEDATVYNLRKNDRVFLSLKYSF